jgi:hypothetical protein
MALSWHDFLYGAEKLPLWAPAGNKKHDVRTIIFFCFVKWVQKSGNNPLKYLGKNMSIPY